MEKEKLFELLDNQARSTVGKLCKRVEVLSKEGNFIPQLYKNLSKELIYESFRNLKALIKVHLEVGRVVFKSKEKN